MEFSKYLSTLDPYEFGEQPKDKKYIKLNTNENPYLPSRKVVDILSNFDTDNYRRYSDPYNSKLKNTIKDILFKENNVNLKQDNIFVGNGSDEVLAFAFAALFNEDMPIGFADITYSFYSVYAKLWQRKYKLIPLKEDFNFDIEKAIAMEPYLSGVVIANPNAPTGIYESNNSIIKLLDAYKDKVVVIDEAYVDFADDSAISLIKKYPNLLIVRTFSKSYSLAGARCGFALSSIEIIKALETVKNSFNSYTVNSMTEAVALAALNDREYFFNNIKKIKLERENLRAELDKIGFKILPSSSNFLFVETSNLISAKKLYTLLKEKAILVRYFDKDRINNFIRVTVGTQRDNIILIETIKEIIRK